MNASIPFNLPYVPTVSQGYVMESIKSKHLHGDGEFTQKSSKIIQSLVGGGNVLLTPSCTHALEMASMLAGIGPGDEVIIPSYTFTSAATAIAKFGGIPVFVDIDAETKFIDLDQLKSAITPKTKAISWVNYAGVAGDVEKLIEIARTHEILLIEDNAHGLGGVHELGRRLGSLGDFATLSFHGTKNVQCGEGGALVVNNSDYLERAEVIREKGTDRKKFVRGEVQKYQWVDSGSSYLLAEPLAAMLLGQLEEFDDIQKARKRIWSTYYEALKDIEFLQLPNSHLSELESVAHMFYFEVEGALLKSQILQASESRGIKINSHYQPLHNSQAGLKFGIANHTYENTIKTAQNLLRLPLYPELQPSQIEKVVTLFQEIKN
jgi:dTDP-4-amino-4,6-dideoxygalactose transaminase